MSKSILIMAAVLILAAGPAWAASYDIDTVYDNVNGSWDDEIPTFIMGQAYDITIEGSGNLFASPLAILGLNVDADNNGSYEENIISGPDFSLIHDYSYTENFTIPDDAQEGLYNSQAWINGIDLQCSYGTKDYQMNVIPEPASLSLVFGGLLGMVGFFRRKF